MQIPLADAVMVNVVTESNPLSSILSLEDLLVIVFLVFWFHLLGPYDDRQTTVIYFNNEGCSD